MRGRSFFRRCRERELWRWTLPALLWLSFPPRRPWVRDTVSSWPGHTVPGNDPPARFGSSCCHSITGHLSGSYNFYINQNNHLQFFCRAHSSSTGSLSSPRAVPCRYLTSCKQSAEDRAWSVPCSDMFFVTDVHKTSSPHHMYIDGEKQSANFQIRKWCYFILMLLTQWNFITLDVTAS